MKRSRLLSGAACLLGLLALLADAHHASAQAVGQGVYVTQAAVRLTKLIDAGNKDGFSLHNNSFSIGGGWLKQSKTEWIALYSLNLTAGKSYRFVAAGDNDAKDVDLEIQDATGKVVAADADADPEARVDFTPPTNGTYLVRIRLYDSRSNVPCVCLGVVLSK